MSANTIKLNKSTDKMLGEPNNESNASELSELLFLKILVPETFLRSILMKGLRNLPFLFSNEHYR